MGPELALAIDACASESSMIIVSIIRKINEVNHLKGKCTELGREAQSILSILWKNKHAIQSLQTLQEFKACLDGVDAFVTSAKTFTWASSAKEVFWNRSYRSLRSRLAALREVFVLESVVSSTCTIRQPEY